MNNQTPTITTKDINQVYSHPAYGVVTVSRPQCTPGVYLFGSDLSHGHYISVTIQTAELERNLHRDWVFPKGQVVEFSMSEAQWGRFGSGAGRSQATPITLNRLSEGPLVAIPGIKHPEKSRKDSFDKEFGVKLDKAMQGINTIAGQLEEVLNDKSISKVKLKGIVANLKSQASSLPKNLDFAVESFKEATEDMVEEAKAEVEAYFIQTAHSYGVGAMAAMVDGSKLIGGADGGADAMVSPEPVSKVVELPKIWL